MRSDGKHASFPGSSSFVQAGEAPRDTGGSELLLDKISIMLLKAILSVA